MIEVREQKEENSKRLGGFIIFLGVLNLVAFIGFGLSTYQVRLEIKEVRETHSRYVVEQSEFIQAALEVVGDNSKRSYENRADLDVKTVKIGVIEESLDPENTRWAKVKQVRKAVTSVIEENYYKGTPNVKDLTTLSAAVVDYSEKYDVPIPLILGVMTRESAFKVIVKSHAKARGLMQIIAPTAEEISQDVGRRHYNIYNIRTNIQFGTWYLWKMMDRFNGDVELAVRAYNCGPTCVERVQEGRWSDYPEETVHYHEAVLKWKSEYEKMGL